MWEPAQRMSMVATVLTQLSIADTRYQIAQDHYGLLKNMMGVNTRLIEYTRSRPEKTSMSEGLQLAAEMDQLLTRARLHRRGPRAGSASPSSIR